MKESSATVTLPVPGLPEREKSVASTSDINVFRGTQTASLPTEEIPMKTNNNLRVSGNRRASYVLNDSSTAAPRSTRNREWNLWTPRTDKHKIWNQSYRPKPSPSMGKARVAPQTTSSHDNIKESDNTEVKTGHLSRPDKSDKTEHVTLHEKILIIAMFLGISCHVTSLVVKEWVKTDHGSFGLWDVCIQHVCSSYKSGISSIQATQSFIVIGLLVAMATTIYLMVFIFKHNRKFHLISLIGSFSAGGCAFISIMVIGTSDLINLGDVGVAMVLAIVAGLCYVCVGIVIVIDKVDIYKKRSKSKELY